LQKTARLSREEFDGKVKKNKTSTIPPTIPKHLQPGPVMPGARGQAATHPYECMTVTCLCPYFKKTFVSTTLIKGHIGSNNQCVLENGRPLTMAYRKEFRMMSDDERNRYHRAMTELKSSGEYDRLTVEHFRVGTASGAHAGPGFLPWHREFLKRVEIALRLVDPTVAIPYWDMVLDNYLDDPRDSILFSPLFVGENDALGNVVTGPYGYWSTTEGGNAIKRCN
ncbi:unnamed protein product, partial [Anisakis simplex]|uniref:Tyrosinase_Cu-bd domain-containing protein n=1 Tax=Anisakis simplex TaxID=6269 RepID=A0A0M3KI40_ANISI